MTSAKPLAIVDAVVVGAGFAGLYMIHRLVGMGMSVQGLERGGDVGGVWYWNRYPGARCDVESMQYSYSWDDALQQDWTWSERFASQPEILRYASHAADRFDLRRHIRFDAEVRSADWDDAAGRWLVETADGAGLSARFLIMATGCLSAARMPDLPGMADFRGRILHTGAWPHDPVSFKGRRVAVIGTGSSGMQAIPVIAEDAGHLTVFQRTANFSVPARNAPMDPAHEQRWKRDYPELRRIAREVAPSGTVYDFAQKSALEADEDERRAEFEARWDKGGVNFMHAYNDILRNQIANDHAADFIRGKIRDLVTDPATAEALTPRGHPVGAKRICVDSGYHATFNRENVDLVDLRAAPIATLTATGIRTVDGVDRTFDSIVLATGYDAMTGALLAVRIAGRGGRTLADKWQDGPRAHLGLMMEGFPNLFAITGPGSPSVLVNVMVAIEQHVDWIARCLSDMAAAGRSVIEPTSAAEDAWTEHVAELADGTLFPKADSWYVGANIPGKPRAFMVYVAGIGPYRRHCDRVAANGYAGMTLR
jgi:cyclohexanone monooxygenase